MYEKKQERFLNKVTNITNNKRLRKIERRIMEVIYIARIFASLGLRMKLKTLFMSDARP